MPINPAIFKAYDIRGIYPSEINEEAVYLIAKAYVKHFHVKNVVVAEDVRTSSKSLKESLVKGLTENGVRVTDIGRAGTDMMYFAVVKLESDGGIIVSASHNPKEYNGLKLVLKNSYPISSDSGIFDLRDLILHNSDIDVRGKSGTLDSYAILPSYIEHIKTFVNFSGLEPMKVVANGNFGMAGMVAEELVKGSPIELVLLNEKPDGEFPKGPPDPLREENRSETIALIRKTGADFGVAWDADADRCFFFDENGEFIHAYYITALLAKILLRAVNVSGQKVISDPRLIWAIKEEVEKSGGIFLTNKVGHTFIKERMRKENALFAGENSAHYYFKDNFYCDNGMIPFLLILEELSSTGKKLGELVRPYKEKYHTPGELNFKVKDVKLVLESVRKFYDTQKGKFEEIDGISFEFPSWRFNLRGSNTEPLIRLNIESTDKKTLDEKIAELTQLIDSEK
ncbi:MAG: phosphomannomutase/phosphoglucomutase [Candidatus Taylorbacteria bacterium]